MFLVKLDSAVKFELFREWIVALLGLQSAGAVLGTVDVQALRDRAAVAQADRVQAAERAGHSGSLTWRCAGQAADGSIRT